MILHSKYRPFSLTIFFLIWGYLIYCYFFEYDSHQHVKRYSYKSRVDSTISLLENWRNLIYYESDLKIQQSIHERDSILKEFKKKPKVVIVPEKIYIEKPVQFEVNVNKSNVPSEAELQNAELKLYNKELAKEIDSLNLVVSKMREKSKSDSTKYKYTEIPKKRRSLFSFLKKSKSSTQDPNPSPDFR